MRIEAPDTGDDWDLAVDTRGGQLVWLPAAALGIPSEAGLAILEGETFESATEAPEDTARYVSDAPVAIVQGRIYAIRTRRQPGTFGTICNYYGKIEPLAVDVDAGTVRFQFDVSPSLQQPRPDPSGLATPRCWTSNRCAVTPTGWPQHSAARAGGSCRVGHGHRRPGSEAARGARAGQRAQGAAKPGIEGDRRRARGGGDAAAEVARMREVGASIGELDSAVASADAWIAETLSVIPNLPDPRVPEGGVGANKVVRSWGTPAEFGFAPRPHWELGTSLGILDLPGGVRVAGSGFIVLRGRGAALQRGLINWMIGLHTAEHGYSELRVPYLVREESMTGTGQLPKFAEESYVTRRDGLWLIPTAEVPVTNLASREILPGDSLPRNMWRIHRASEERPAPPGRTPGAC